MRQSSTKSAGGLKRLLAGGFPIWVSVLSVQAQPLAGEMAIHAADPSVIRTANGYVAIEARAGRTLFVRIAPSLTGLADAKAVRVWSDRQGLGEVWAPEIVFRNQAYEVYFTAGVGSDHRMYVIGSDQPASAYGAAREIELPDDKWAIDGLPLSYGGLNYFIWSGWQGDSDGQQDIFIAKLGADGQVQSPRVIIASPDQPWENIARESPTINEGPQAILDPAGRLHVVYSANGSWGEHYCLADLRLRADGDPLDPADWFESDGCLFGADPATLAPGATLAQQAKGVGHHSFALPDGDASQAMEQAGTMPFLYHGVASDEHPDDFWAARNWYLGRFHWVPDVAYRHGDSRDDGFGLKFLE